MRTPFSPEIEQKRLDVNAAIAAFAVAGDGDDGEPLSSGVVAFGEDPRLIQTDPDNEDRWDDNLHCSPDGYKVVGELAYEALSSLL